jgi:hypothetical protein
MCAWRGKAVNMCKMFGGNPNLKTEKEIGG